jgi:hypothetical protein
MAKINIFTYNEKIAVQIKETAKRYKKNGCALEIRGHCIRANSKVKP